MDTAKPAVSFDEIINRDRAKKQYQDLAQQIFGKNRRTSEPAKNANRRPPPSAPSLASRTGIAKRSSSSTNVKPQRNNPFITPKPPSRPSSAAAQIARTNRIASAVNSSTQANILPSTQTSRPAPTGPGLSIKGSAVGPHIVHAKNFAPGTTAADIESALNSVAIDSQGTNGIVSCRIMATSPSVMAEMIFNERDVADKVISTFNNQKADGRILHVYLHASGPSAASRIHKKKSDPALYTSDPTPTPVSKELIPEKNGGTPPADDDIEMIEEEPVYSDSRQAADRERESRRAEPDVQDRSYGFGDRSDQPASSSSRDEPRRDERNGSRRDYDRDRRHDDRSYDRRDDRGDRSDRGAYGRGVRYNTSYDRGGRPPYGNGGPGPGRGSYGGGYGRMYSDDVMRGGRGGYRGRGAYR